MTTAATATAPSLVLGEFPTVNACLSALSGLRGKGFGAVDLYSPYPVPEAYPLLELPRSPMPMFILIGGLTGGLTGLAMQLWCNGVDYPLNIGGKPLLSVTASIPITFEMTILFGGLTAFFGLWAWLRLPRPYHPVFEVAHFGSSAVDHFWVSIASSGELELARARQALESAGAARVETVHTLPEDH